MKQFLYLGFATLIAVAAVGGYAYLLSSIMSTVNVVAATREDIAAFGERERFLRSASVFLTEIEEAREQVNAFVAQDADFVSVIETVEASAGREGVAVSIGSVQVVDRGGKSHDGVTMTLSAEGAFSRLASFVAALETLPLASRVTSVSLEEAAGNTWFARITLEFIKQKTS